MKKRDTVLEKLIAVSRLTDACVMALDELITREATLGSLRSHPPILTFAERVLR